jgi:Carboxypeptidase regulatory-like domain
METARKPGQWLPATFVAALVLLRGSPSLAQVGDTRDALPGIVHVPVAGTAQTGAALSASGGYGYTEAVLGRGDQHDRAFGTIAGSVRPTPWLAFALELDGRYDHDVDPVQGSSNSFVGDPRLFARVGTDLAHGFRIGAQLGLWIPGDHAPSLVLDASTLDVIAMAAYAPPGSPLVLAVHVGGRWDNSAASVPDAARLSESARLGLGINDASGILSGIGASVRVARRLEILGDLSADWLVGRDAPAALESPIVAALAARWDANERRTVSLQLTFEASPSERPDLAPGQVLVDVEPRFSTSIGFVFHPGAPAAKPAPAPEPPPEEPAPEPASLPAPKATVIKGKVTTSSGAPLAHAQVRLTPLGGEPIPVETDADGGFEFQDVAFGSAALEVNATGYAVANRDVRVAVGETAVVAIALDPAIPPAQIRGVVRDFAGKPVAASVVIEPVGTTAVVRPDGGFELDVRPGTYDVVITAKGYAPQRRKVVVEPQGVTLLNVDLRSAR